MGAYSPAHIVLSKELAFANPELTLPMFCGEWKERGREGGKGRRWKEEGHGHLCLLAEHF